MNVDNRQSDPAPPGIYGVCLVLNEEDIIADSLRHAARFCEKIYVIDNASSDRTWEIVKDLKSETIVPVGSIDFTFRDYLRVWFMESRREEIGFGNWWYILDADMFLEEDPRPAVARAEKEGADTVTLDVVNFHITAEEIETARKNNRKESWRDRRFYHLYESGEPDLFKNSPDLDYGICGRAPFGLTRECSRRLTVRHYPYRSIEQLKKRVRSRFRNREFASEYRRGEELAPYLVDPSRPGIKKLSEKGEIDFTGGFSRVNPRIGTRSRDTILRIGTRGLRVLGLLRLFYRAYNRYAFLRQGVDPREKKEFLAKIENAERKRTLNLRTK